MSNNAKRDEERIGRLLADGLQDLAVDIPCLTEEQLDNLAAGTVSTEEKERCYSHIAGCSVCNHAFIVTQRLAKAETTELSKHIRPAWSYIAPITLAATVLLAVGLYRFLPPKSDVGAPLVAMKKPPEGQGTMAQAPEPAPPSPLVATGHKPQMTRQESLLAMAENLGKAARGKELDIPLAAAGQAGFASDGAAEANRFHTGFALTSLVAACNANDRSLLQRSSSTLATRLLQMELPEDALKKISIATTAMEKQPDNCTELTRVAAEALQTRFTDNPYLLLGVWTATVRLAAHVRNTDLFKEPEFVRMNSRIDKLAGSRGVAEKVVAIIAIGKGKVNDDAWNRIDALADDLQKQF